MGWSGNTECARAAAAISRRPASDDGVAATQGCCEGGDGPRKANWRAGVPPVV